MKNIGRFMAGLLAMVAFSGVAHAWTISGTLRQPFDPNQHWTDCPSIGYKNPADQIFMQWNDNTRPDGTKINAYHMAEDWNGACGASTDMFAPLYAIGDGFVRDVRNDPNENKTIGKSLIVRYTLPDGSQVDSVYWHVQSIYVSVGMNVQNGDLIATIGNAASSDYPYGLYPAHLHWEIRKGTAGLALNWNTNSYVNPLTIAIANNYTSPSLFIDDRKTSNTYGLSSGSWMSFTPSFNAPSSTAYVEYGTGRYSLKRAVDNGLIWQYVYVQISGKWYYYPDITQVTFDAGNTYAVYGFVPNANLFILTPGHNFQKDRAKIDMIRVASGNSNFKSVKPDYFRLYSSDQSFDYWEMPFTYNSGSGDQAINIYQATLRSNSLVRYTIYYDPATGNWTPWKTVDPNILY